MCKLHSFGIALLLLAACTKTDPKADPTAPAPSASEASFQITGTPPSASAKPAVTTVASATTTAVASAERAAAVKKDAGTPTKDMPATTPASTRLTGKNFTLDVATPGCRVNEACQVTLSLAALESFHVNKDYPYKFVPKTSANVEYAATQFTKESGDFKETGPKNAILTVRFKPTAKGNQKVTGTYKMSVCSDENCQIEQPSIDLDVPVL